MEDHRPGSIREPLISWRLVRSSDLATALFIAISLVAAARWYLARTEQGLIHQWSATLQIGASSAAQRLASWREHQLDEARTLARLVSEQSIDGSGELRLIGRPDVRVRDTGAVSLRVEPSDSNPLVVVVTVPFSKQQVLERRTRAGTAFSKILPRVPVDPTGRPYVTAVAEMLVRSDSLLVVINPGPPERPDHLSLRSYAEARVPPDLRADIVQASDSGRPTLTDDAIRVIADGGFGLAVRMSIARGEALRDMASMRRTVWAMVAVALVLLTTLLGAVRIARESARRRRAAELARHEAEGLLARAQLDALRGQLQPHFLFNTLNTIVGLTETDPASTRRVVEALSELLRISLDLDKEPEVTVVQELEMLEPYLEIQTIRFGERVRFDIRVDRQVHNALMPRLLLQPLVENAIRHGIAPRARGGSVQISIGRDGSELVISVDDDGVGLEGKSVREGVGLSNTRSRLGALYGGAASMTIADRSGGGATVSIRLPLPRLPLKSPAAALAVSP